MDKKLKLTPLGCWSVPILSVPTFCSKSAVILIFYSIIIAMKAQELYQQGFDLGRRRLYKEAVEALSQAINLNPGFAEAHIVRADAQTLLGNLQGAVEDFQQAIDIYRARGQSQIADMLLVPLNSLQNEIKFNQEDQVQPEVEDEPKAK
ncbi:MULTISPECIES: hypothetical protein [unclassified Microcoleus]|uniref:hypothetical protein n=1 Tax=unclassified Microcoleus TaxID=2642155 RepID=UPI002FD76173